MVFGKERRYRELYETLGGGRRIPVTYLQDHFLKHLKLLDITEEEAEAVVNVADLNRDNLIDYDEFELLMESPLGQSTRMKRLMTLLMPWPKKLESFFIPMIIFVQQVWNLRKADSLSTRTQRLTTLARGVIMFWLTKSFFIVSISIVQIVVFFMYYNNEYREDTDCPGCFYRVKNQWIPGPFIFVPGKRAQVWRFASYMFLHTDWSHLIGNVFFQLLFGIAFEIAHKFWRTASLYVLAVIAGALLQYAMDPGMPLVGAAAGVYALIAAHLADVFMNWSVTPLRNIRLIFIACSFLNFGYDFYLEMSECHPTSLSAQVAGAITGFCYAVVVIDTLVEHKHKRRFRWVCAIVIVFFFVTMITMTILRPPFARPLWTNKNCAESQWTSTYAAQQVASIGL